MQSTLKFKFKVTDGCAGTATSTSLLPAAFPCTLHTVCIASPNDPSLITCSYFVQNLIIQVCQI